EEGFDARQAADLARPGERLLQPPADMRLVGRGGVLPNPHLRDRLLVGLDVLPPYVGDRRHGRVDRAEPVAEAPEVGLVSGDGAGAAGRPEVGEKALEG